MKNILIIYPHWVPSNLAGVHRARLIANFLPEFNYQPIILTVKSEFYEEPPDNDLHKTASEKIKVIYVNARKVGKIRMIGDIGLRSFKFLKKEALNIIKNTKIDFIWIPIPSFYIAILGRVLYNKTKTPYGIDYIDPWVRDISNRKNFRSVTSLLIAKILEPYAVKKASLISGVSYEYYKPVLDKNFHRNKIAHVAMPYGFDPNDHKIKIQIKEYPWTKYPNCKPIIYAGAFLPNSVLYIKKLFKIIKKLKNENIWNDNWHIFFVGTGNYPSKSIREYAEDFNISENIHEIKQRFPFLHILNFLSAAHRVMIIGSTEKHYTASKTFQALLSERPVYAMMHAESSTVKIMNSCNAGQFVVKYEKEINETDFEHQIEEKLIRFLNDEINWKPELQKLNKFSAKNSTQALLDKISLII